MRPKGPSIFIFDPSFLPGWGGSYFETTQNTLITENDIEKITFDDNASLLPKRIKARHILIAHKNALNAPPSLRRNRSAAKALAQDILKQIQAGENFTELSKKYSDDPNTPKGGLLGVFEAHQMMQNFSSVAFRLDEKELGMCETLFGYHIIQRLPLDERTFKHLVIQWKGGPLSKSTTPKTQAKENIDQAYLTLQRGVDIDHVIRNFSEGPMASRGGSTGWIEESDLGPALRKKAFALDVGAYTSPIESHLGYHIIYRQE